MNKKFGVMMLALVLMSISITAGAEDYLLARFRPAAQEARENYLPGGRGDELTTCTHFQRFWDPVAPSGGWLANQFRAPDIATPVAEGPEGGNALFSNSHAADSTREGYWIQLNSAISGSFTLEVFFYLDELDSDYTEYKMQNIISSFWMSDNKALELRYFGPSTTLTGMEDTIQMMTSDGGTVDPEHNVTSSAGVISADTWYYAAVVYDHNLSEASFYLADASDPENITPGLVGSADPNWGSFAIQWLCLAAWPNPAGMCRDMAGYIDAFGISFEALEPANFVLLNLPELPLVTAAGANWSLYE